MSIDTTVQTTIEECAMRSCEGSIDFASVVAKLTTVGVESYHADYRHKETTYYLPSGETHVVKLSPPNAPIAEQFDLKAVHDAIRGAQRGEIKYQEFMRLTMISGCIGYIVWIAGRHVQYLGRRGEVHTEHFPSD